MAERTRPVESSTAPPSTTEPDPSTAQFALPAEGFALAPLFERVPGARVELEPAVATPDDRALVSVRAEEDEATVHAALAAGPSVARAQCFGERPEGWTYRVTWQDRARDLLGGLVAANVTLSSAHGLDGQWQFRVLAPDRAGISRASEVMDGLDCGAECRRIATADGDGTTQAGLTDKQHEVLVAAFEAGYYDIPRGVTAEELADDIGISHQALSERLRRATEHLVGNHLGT